MKYDGNYRDTTKSRTFRVLEYPSQLLRVTLVPLFRSLDRGAKILYYHEMREELFRAHVEYLTSHYSIVPLSELVTALQTGTPVADDAVAIVFDDGRRTLYTDVFPVVTEYEIPITVYLVTGAVSDGIYFWDKANALKRVDDAPGEIPDLAALPRAERSKTLERALSAHDIAFERTALNWEEITEMHAGGVDFQPHTVTHPSLPNLPPAEIEAEISESRARIERELGTEASHFSYPFGHCSDTVVEILREQGFESAVGVEAGANTPATDRYRLRRIGVETASPSLLATLTEGVWHTLAPGRAFES